jgi:two-component system sensor histidine kinase UhpB
MPRALVATPPRRSLVWRLFSINASVMIAAAAVLVLAPIKISVPVKASEGLVVGIGLMAMLILDLVLMRRGLQPLGRLRRVMLSVDPLSPGQRIDIGARSADVADLTTSFNEMLERLEAERRSSARRAQAAQEAERRWLSLELHDEIGQSLTALLLQLNVAAHGAPPAQAQAINAGAKTARDCLERIRGLVKHLRPEALDDLGLNSALLHLCDRMATTSGLEIRPSLARDLPGLSPDAQLVVYRVIRESLTNVVRHSDATSVDVEFVRDETGVMAHVHDNGRGVGPLPPGSGIRGMRERALLIGSTLEVERDVHGGVSVRLRVAPEELSAT